ncbi:MAG: NADP oxidoreductase [Pseudomonadales bacterium]|nr:MAG: NADP oxidoreductase [Pseudomonadales bacterium]
MRVQRVGPYPIAKPPPAQRLIGSLLANKRLPRHALLQALGMLQYHCGWISPNHLSDLSRFAKLSIGEIKGIIEFYHFLSLQPPKPYCIYLSTNIIDRWQRAGLDLSLLEENENVDVKQTSCVGMCDQGGSLLINGLPLTGLTQERIEKINDLILRQEPLSQWPQDWFTVEESIHVKGPLLTHSIQPGDALNKARKLGEAGFLKILQASNLRGRGGAGFPTHLKWKACIDARGDQKYIVCNADEGEPGTFKDRLLLTSYLAKVIEGMCIAAWMTGASRGFIYLRYEYIYLLEKIQATLSACREQGVLDSATFDIEVMLGAGAYICGEESAMLESMEGKRGIPRIRPPFPVTHGLFDKPTIVNNVETFCNIAYLADDGLQAFIDNGNAGSRGSKIHSVAGDCERSGIYEYPFGSTVKEMLHGCGGEQAQAVQVGGPSGKLVLRADFDTPVDFDHVSSSGSFMVFGPGRDLKLVAQNFLHFFKDESCGFCTPCRVGTQVLAQHFDRVCEGLESQHEWELMNDIASLMGQASHCGLGHTAANPFIDWRDNNVTADSLSAKPEFIPVFDLAKATAYSRSLREENHDN